MVPPVGAAMGKSRWPANARSAMSPANRSAPSTRPEQRDRAERTRPAFENDGAAQHGSRMERQHVSRAVEPHIRDRMRRGGGEDNPAGAHERRQNDK